MERTNVTDKGYTFNNQNFANETRTDSQGNNYTVAIPTAISSSSLTPQTPINVTQPVYNTNGQQTQANTASAYTNSAFADAENLQKQNEITQRNELGFARSDLGQLQREVGGKGTDLVSAYNQQDASGNSVNSLAGKLRTLSARSQALGIDNLAKGQAEINKATGQNITSTAVQRNTADVTRENLINQASIAMESAILKADYDTAKSYADQMVDAKYDQKLADIEAAKTNIDNIKSNLTATEKKRAEATTQRLEKEKQDYEEKKANEKDLQNLSLSIAKNGAPQNIVSKIANAKSFNEAVITASPYMQSLSDKADLSYKLAQTAKIYNDMKNDNATTGGNVAPENMLPFAQEYAATGKVPVGAPKGSQASIMRYAKELPQATGSLVSSITGVKNTSLGVEAQGDIVRLYNITQAVKELKKLDKERVGGLVAGTFGKVFGSEAQSAYLAKRKSIVDDISRMQSGAALTPDEVAFYEDYLPGRLSETAGLGQDSMEKIENFEKIMNEKLKNSLSNNQLSIYGYSTIKADNGQEYTVGDLIQVNGRTGRINPDGTVTVIE